jgi:hypothetical protein
MPTRHVVVCALWLACDCCQTRARIRGHRDTPERYDNAIDPLDLFWHAHLAPVVYAADITVDGESRTVRTNERKHR